MKFACHRKHGRLMNAFIVISAAVILTLDLITPLSAGTLEDAATARERGDYSTALRLFRLLAEKGDPRAQSNLGVMYAKGEGVPQNYAEALKWFRLGADQGNARAQSGLGVMYAKGDVVPQNYAEALKWFRLAANQGDAKGEVSISGSCTPRVKACRRTTLRR